MWNDCEMITIIIKNIDKWKELWLWSTTQHNTFTESIGCAVAIETIQTLRCVWETSLTYTHTHTCMHAKVVFQ